MVNKIYDIEDRLVEYSCRMIDVVEALPNTRTGNYIAGQLIKSCISPTFNYGEVQGAVPQNAGLFINLALFKGTKGMQNCLKNYQAKRAY